MRRGRGVRAGPGALGAGTRVEQDVKEHFYPGASAISPIGAVIEGPAGGQRLNGAVARTTIRAHTPLNGFTLTRPSGDVLVAVRGDRMTNFKADTGSGDVTLRMDADASFEANCDISSGDIVSHYRDAEPILKDRELVGFRRGSAKTRITVDTGSGDFVIEPNS